MTKELNRFIRTLKRKEEQLITPRLELWLATGEGLLPLDDELAEVLRQLVTAKERARESYFHPSGIGRCERQQVFAFLGMPTRVRLDSTLQNLFNDGTWRHIRWQMMLLKIGLLTRIEVKFRNRLMRFRGSGDGINDDEGWGFELKGTSNLAAVVHNGLPPLHVKQVHGYFVLAELAGEPVDRWVYVAEDKRSQDWKEIVVVKDPKEVRRVKNELHDLNEAIEHEQLPAVLKECERGTGPTFNNCQYSQWCLGQKDWPEDNTWHTNVPTPRRRTKTR